MKPSLEDFLSSSAQWRGEYRGISYQLNWHGRSDYSPEGTWCWYIFVNQEQFYPEDWAKLRLEKEDRQWHEGGLFHRHFKYDDFPDLDAHGGWTFGEMSVYLGRDGVEYEMVKVGCDYAHLWDREQGFWQGKSNIEFDCKQAIDRLVEMFPKRRTKCAYSGKYGDESEFYTAQNGSKVHVSFKDKSAKEIGAAWRPAETAA